MPVSVTPADIEAYDRDGVVLLRGAVGDEWIEALRHGVRTNLTDPSDRARVWDCDDAGCTTVYDSQSWHRIPEYQAFIRRSPLAALVGEVMAVESLTFFFDAIFVRSAGTRFRTPFHQDEPYWSVAGHDCSSVWMPLVPVAKKSALEFVRGSHRWGARYRQENFGRLTGDDRDRVDYGDDWQPFPDIEGERDRYEILSWDMEPGDAAVFNARVIHGGSGNLDPGRDLPVFNTQWLGDDVRVCFRAEGMDPDHSPLMRSLGLGPGDRVSGEPYPEVWRRS